MIEKYALFKVFNGLRENKEGSVRSIAKKSKVGVATSKICLDYLLKNKIVKRKEYGRMYQYRLNEDNVLARQLKICSSIAEINNSGLIEELLSKVPYINSIILFGSVGLGKDKPDSDIDLLVISRRDINIPELLSEKKLRREVSFIKYTHLEWRGKANKDKPFYDEVISEGIPLYGDIPMVK